jgi:thiol-disulfide isomerase/thioredoxin
MSIFTKKLPVSLFILLWLQHAQCSAPTPPLISGHIQRSAAWKPMVYMVQPRNFMEIGTNYSGVVLDSAAIAEDGYFEFKPIFEIKEKILVQLCIQKVGNRFNNQLMDDNPMVSNYIPLVLQYGDHLEITAESDLFQATFGIKNPSQEQLKLLQLRDIRHQAYQKEQDLLTTTAHLDENTLLAHEDALRRYRQPMMDFADSSASLWPALMAIRWVSPAGDYERVPEFIFGQCQKWGAADPENPWVQQLCQTGNKARLPVMIGDQFPNALLPMASGDTLNVHVLLGSRLTILDVWASWCMPCRGENKEVLSPLWAQYKESGLKIVGYSIDSNPNAWKAAITKDNAVWPHASHLSGDATPLLETLRITTIPANFMLDATGKVVAKNLHGADLQAFVAAYLK